MLYRYPKLYFLSDSPGKEVTLGFFLSVFAQRISSMIAQKVLLGMFVQHFNLPFKTTTLSKVCFNTIIFMILKHTEWKLVYKRHDLIRAKKREFPANCFNNDNT